MLSIFQQRSEGLGKRTIDRQVATSSRRCRARLKEEISFFRSESEAGRSAAKRILRHPLSDRKASKHSDAPFALSIATLALAVPRECSPEVVPLTLLPRLPLPAISQPGRLGGAQEEDRYDGGARNRFGKARRPQKSLDGRAQDRRLGLPP